MFKRKGDVYCVAWLLSSALNGYEKARQELRMSMSNIKYASEYVKFLNNKKYNSDYVIEFFKKFSSIYRNKDNYLIVLASNPQIDSKSYKTFSALLKTQTNWEKQTLQTINKNIGKSDNKYHKRIIKQIRKVNAVTSKKKED